MYIERQKTDTIIDLVVWERGLHRVAYIACQGQRRPLHCHRTLERLLESSPNEALTVTCDRRNSQVPQTIRSFSSNNPICPDLAAGDEPLHVEDLLEYSSKTTIHAITVEELQLFNNAIEVESDCFDKAGVR